MRTILVATALAAIMLPAGASPTPSRSRTTPLTERIPNTNFNNAYPRWLSYAVVKGINGDSKGMSVGVDSRNSVHLAVLEYPYWIRYRNDWLKERKSSGFSDGLIIADRSEIHEGGFTAINLDVPDLCVEQSTAAAQSDRLHVAWSTFFRDPNLMSAPNDWTDIFYKLKDASGWSGYVQLTNAALGHYYTSPAVVVDASGTPHIFAIHYDWTATNPNNYTAVIVHITLNGGTPSVQEINDSKVYSIGQINVSPSIRAAYRRVGASEKMYVTWESKQTFNSTNADVRYVAFTNGSPETSTTISSSGNNVGPDVAIDSTGGAHFVWGNTDVDGVLYKTLSGSQSQVSTQASSVSSFNAPRIAIDSRDQIHVVWGGLRYGARVKNPDPDQLDPTWRLQEKIVAPRADDFNMVGVKDVAISKSDTLHVVGLDFYTRTMEYGLGIRDSAAMIPIFPGGSANVTNGNIHARVGLFSTAGVGPSQACSMLHNTLEAYPGLTSSGWKLNYEIYLTNHRLDNVVNSATLFLDDGRPIHFKKNTSLGYLVADDEYGHFDKLEFIGSVDTPTYTVTTKFGFKLEFSDAGKLQKIKEPTGNFLELTWDDNSGQLTTITDMKGNAGPGRSSTIAYENGVDARYFPRIDTITDPGSKTCKFLYSGSSLSDIKFQSGPSQPTYHFDYYTANDPSSGQRIGLIQNWKLPRGYPWKVKYLPDGRVADAADPKQVSLALTFKEDSPVAETRETMVNTRRGFDWKYKVEPRRALALEIFDPTVLPSPPAGFSQVIRQFDTYGNLTHLTDRWGQVTTYTFFTSPRAPVPAHVKDNLNELRRPLAGTNPTVRYENYTALSKPQKVTTWATQAGSSSQTARVTKHQYNGFGQPTQTTFPDVTPPDGPAQTAVTIQYEFNGPRYQLTKITNEEGHWTQFDMFSSPSGLPDRATREGGSSGSMFQHDIMGNVTHTRLPDGGPGSDAVADTVTEYDGLWRVATVTDPLQNATQYVYNVDNLLEEVHPPVGGATTTTYDERGFVIGGANPDGSWSQEVDAHGNPTKITNMRQGVTDQTFDQLDRRSTSNGPAVNSSYTYDDVLNGQHRSHATVGGRETITVHDERGRATEIIAPDNDTKAKIFYDEQDQEIAREIRKGGAVQTCKVLYRDARDRVQQVRTQDYGYQDTGTSYFDVFSLYSKTGAVTKTNDPGFPISGTAHTTTFVLDARDRVELVVDGKGVAIQQNKYGDDDLVWQALTPDPATKSESLVVAETRTYTARKELKTSKNRNGKGFTNEYGPEGQIDRTTDALGRITKTFYHSNTQRPSQVATAYQSGDQSSTFYEWENGFLSETRVWNPASFSYTASHGRTYDSAFRPKDVTGPMVATGTSNYDPTTGELHDVTMQGANSFRKVTHHYNLLGQSDHSDWSGVASGSQDRTFNGLGMVTSRSDGIHVHTMEYQTWRGAPDLETLSTGGFSKSMTHTVDFAGNVTGLSDPEAVTHTWPVDENNRPLAQTYAGQSVVTLEYTPGGLLDRSILRKASGAAIAETVHLYDGIGRKSRSVTFKAGSGQVLTDFGWGYDDADQVTSLTLGHLGVTFTFEYNLRGELKREVTAGNGGPPPYTNQIGSPTNGQESGPSPTATGSTQTILAVPARDATYDIDPGGNRKTKTVDGVTTTYQYNAASQLYQEDTPAHGSTPVQSISYQYDDFGNLHQKTTTDGPPMTDGTVITTETYTYNYLNLMDTYVRTVQILPNSSASLAANWLYDYWPGGERYAKTNVVTGSGELYVPRFGDVVCEYDKASGGAPTVKNAYVQGLGIDTKTTRVPYVNGVPDSNNRRHFVGDQVGTLGMTLDESAVTLETSVKDVWGNQIAGTSSERYSGLAQREVDGETSLVHMRARMYDSKIGRFTQNDPIIANRPFEHYSYGRNNPLQYRDPQGTDALDEIMEGVVELVQLNKRLAPWVEGTKAHTEMAKAGGFIRSTLTKLADSMGYQVLFEAEMDTNGLLTGKVNAPKKIGGNAYLDAIWIKKEVKEIALLDVRAGLKSGEIRVFDWKFGRSDELTKNQRAILKDLQGKVKTVHPVGGKGMVARVFKLWQRIQALPGVKPATTAFKVFLIAAAATVALSESQAAYADVTKFPPELKSAGTHAFNAVDAFVGTKDAWSFGSAGGELLRGMNVRQALKDVGLGEIAMDYPEGNLGDLLNKSGEELGNKLGKIPSIPGIFEIDPKKVITDVLNTIK